MYCLFAGAADDVCNFEDDTKGDLALFVEDGNWVEWSTECDSDLVDGNKVDLSLFVEDGTSVEGLKPDCGLDLVELILYISVGNSTGDLTVCVSNFLNDVKVDPVVYVDVGISTVGFTVCGSDPVDVDRLDLGLYVEDDMRTEDLTVCNSDFVDDKKVDLELCIDVDPSGAVVGTKVEILRVCN